MARPCFRFFALVCLLLPCVRSFEFLRVHSAPKAIGTSTRSLNRAATTTQADEADSEPAEENIGALEMSAEETLDDNSTTGVEESIDEQKDKAEFDAVTNSLNVEASNVDKDDSPHGADLDIESEADEVQKEDAQLEAADAEVPKAKDSKIVSKPKVSGKGQSVLSVSRSVVRHEDDEEASDDLESEDSESSGEDEEVVSDDELHTQSTDDDVSEEDASVSSYDEEGEVDSSQESDEEDGSAGDQDAQEAEQDAMYEEVEEQDSEGEGEEEQEDLDEEDAGQEEVDEDATGSDIDED